MTSEKIDRDATVFVAKLRADVVGRRRELELLPAAVESGCDIVLEGPPGTSKTTELLAIRASGLTNISFPLEAAEQELRRAGDGRRRVLLLSDCVHNAGPDPRVLAARLPRLDVLFDISGEKDPDLARDLARLGRGLALPIRGATSVVPALNRILEDG